jgi:hypothetical protein
MKKSNTQVYDLASHNINPKVMSDLTLSGRIVSVFRSSFIMWIDPDTNYINVNNIGEDSTETFVWKVDKVSSTHSVYFSHKYEVRPKLTGSKTMLTTTVLIHDENFFEKVVYLIIDKHGKVV